MLTTLKIKNFAIVDNIQVEFGHGLNVITGETGAGKSILAAALGLVLGGRGEKNMIRSGEDKCGVEAQFELADSSRVDMVLDELGVEACDKGRLIIRRIISASDSSKNLVNDCPVTVQGMKRIGDLLVDLHGPHDHQSLLSTDFQMDLLDSFGQLTGLRGEYEDIYREKLDAESRRKALDCDDQAVERQIEMLSFQVKEIEDAKLSAEEEEEIEKEHKISANAQQVLEAAGQAVNALSEGEVTAFDAVVAAQNALRRLTDVVDEAQGWVEEAESIAVQIQELEKSLNSYVQNVQCDPERLQWLEDRKALIHKLKRKYGGSIENILAFLEKSRGELEDLQHRGEKIAEIEKELVGIRKRVEATGGKLSGERRKVAEELAVAITDELRELGFKHGAFDVSLGDVEPGPNGMNSIEFGFAPNVGEDMRPLRAIASSGEISRVMLAVKAVLACHDSIPVMVFDEIDANVGGEMGNAVGAKLEKVSMGHQVLCITHLPQVAVHGNIHLVVVKHVKDGRTMTSITAVEGDKRTREIARMLGGEGLTSVTLRHASEMLEKKSGIK